ncbi:MAG TPA: fucose isomerase [Planctomycetota bacterium]|nr:fucose isomerase [Planctomycetota bacterium]
MTPKVGLVSFSDPRSVKGLDSINQANIACQNGILDVFRKAGLDVVVPLPDTCVTNRELVKQVLGQFAAEEVHAVVLGCWKWTDPMLAVETAQRANVPVCLVCTSDETMTGMGCMSAIGASLWEIDANDYCRNHARIIDDFDGAVLWVRGVSAAEDMQRRSVMLWGGSYCLKMEHLRDDPAALKGYLIGDVLLEGQYLLIRRAEQIAKQQPERIEKFITWLQDGGASIVYDRKMLTVQSLRRQVALYLAARDRLAELEGEDVIGVSVRCQPELSVEYGVTGCLLPAFLPFGADSEGPRTPIATTCEGDIKGLLTSLLLERIHGSAPAGFGDIRNLPVRGKQHLLISNCGAASVFYAANSFDPKRVLPELRFRGQCQGESGAAVGYSGKPAKVATICRIVRKAGQYSMQMATGRMVRVTDQEVKRLNWGDVWPLSLFDIELDLPGFVEKIGSNHYSFVPGDHTRAVEHTCRLLDMQIERLS